MATFREAISTAARTLLCAQLGNLANLADIFSDLTEPAPVSSQYAFIANGFRLACNREPNAPPPTPPALNGGQCQALYRVTFNMIPSGGQWRNFVVSPTEPRPVSADFWGPISNLRMERTAFSPPDNVSTWSPAITRFTNGTEPPGSSGNPRNDTIFLTGQAVQPATAVVTITNVEVTRLDGLPDNCGSPPPTPPFGVPTPDYRNTQTNITYRNEDGIDITIPVGFFFANAFIDANLDVNIPVHVTINFDVSFPINFNISTGGISFNFGGGANNPDGSPPPAPPPPPPRTPTPDGFETEEPPPPPPPDPEFEDEEEPPPTGRDRVIRGVIVTASSVDSNRIGVIFQSGGNPDIRIPGLGFVSFKIQVGSSVAWTNDIPVKNDRAFIECPWDGGAIEVRGSSRPGVAFQLTPVLAKPSTEFEVI